MTHRGSIRRALIIGVAGQDGTLLARALSRDGVDVVGVCSDGRVTGDVEGIPARARLNDADEIYALVRAVRPDAVFYLAAYHHSSELGPAEPDIIVWKKSFAVHTDGLLHVLDACVGEAPHAHVVYASSSHVFGTVDSAPQDERAPLRPKSPYAVSKVAGMNICRACREKGVRASVAILFNHESALRARHFVTQRVAFAVAGAQLDKKHSVSIELGAPDAVVDWTAAEDVVDALRAIAALPEPDDFVVASGHARTVRELCTVAGQHAGVVVEVVAKEQPALRRQSALIGDALKLRERTGWQPRASFEEWVGRMVDAARDALERERAAT